MTIICIKDGVVAADGSTWSGNVLASRETKKIFRSIDGAISGSAGNSVDTQTFRRWFGSTENPESRQGSAPTFDKEDSFAAVWLERDGAIWRLDWGGKPYRYDLQEIAAIGAAKELALGAMYAGASAEQAVRICVERHDCAGGDVFVERQDPVTEDFVEVEEARTYRPDLFDADGKPLTGAAQEYAKWRAETFVETEDMALLRTAGSDPYAQDPMRFPSQADDWRERMGFA